MSPLSGPLGDWLALERAGTAEPRFRMRFGEHHIGNPMIRALHGGVVAAVIEVAATAALREQLGDKAAATRLEPVSSSIDYLRVTKDADLNAKAIIARVGRRLAFVDVWCWQDDEETPVVRGACTLRILQAAM